MFLSLLFFSAVLSGASNAPAVSIRKVEIEGNHRISSLSILRQISAIPNIPFDPAIPRNDLKKLYSLGIFEDLKIESRDAGEGQVDLVYTIREYPLISGFSIEGVEGSLEEQIQKFLQKEKLDLRPASPCNPAVVNKTALAIRDFLRGHKHPNADVHFVEHKRGDTVRVSMQVQPGTKLEIGAVRFVGNESISKSELLGQMRHSRPAFFIARWGGAARYIPEELDSDLQRIRFYYQSKGFAAASVGPPRIAVNTTKSKPWPAEKQRIEIEIPVAEGFRYSLASLKLEGDPKSAVSEVNDILSTLHTPQDYNFGLLEEKRQRISDVLGRHGYALARVRLAQTANDEERTIDAVYRIDAGSPVAIGRIDFTGNKRIPDKFLRRELRVSEGEVFDTAKLDQSVQRLNKSNLVSEIARADVSLNMNEKTGMLDIMFNLKEKEHQGIYATGGSGGIGGGYLGILYTAFNLLHLGERLSLELDGGVAQSNMLLNIIGTHFLGSPVTLALSVFNRYTNFNVANLVPGPESLVGVLRRRSAGAGLSGAYPLKGNIQVGLGFEVERESVTNETPSASSPSQSWRSEAAPFLVYDSTRGSGAAMRGSRFAYGQAFDGSLFLGSLDSTRESLQLSRYAGDPLTHGRNSFAFHLQAGMVRPSGNEPLLLERRFYPGNEVVRGLNKGSLSPWIAVPNGSDITLQPAGADTLLGFSTEYRVPIRGPLSGAVFFDLGWTHLNPKNAAQFGSGAMLVQRANGILRASLGGEMRLQLPVIQQPARFIFSWNPLRLDTFFQNPASIMQLADPRTAFRLALGTFY
jgi:outer membrane protein insertion porin family